MPRELSGTGRRAERLAGSAAVPRVSTHHFRDVLDYETGARMFVEFTRRRREVIDYAVVLSVDHDGAHAVNEMHRYTRRAEKMPAEIFHAGTLGEGMRTAIEAVRTGHKEMIQAWRAS